MDGLSQKQILLIVTLIQWALAYWVYKDTVKWHVPYRNVWIVAVFLFWPFVIVYFFYRRKAARGAELSTEQKAMLHMQERAAEERKRIAEHRAAFDSMKAEEASKNRLTDAEMDKIREERKAAKAKRMAELEEERKLQEERFADTLRVKQEKLADTVAENLKPKKK